MVWKARCRGVQRRCCSHRRPRCTRVGPVRWPGSARLEPTASIAATSPARMTAQTAASARCWRQVVQITARSPPAQPSASALVRSIDRDARGRPAPGPLGRPVPWSELGSEAAGRCGRAAGCGVRGDTQPGPPRRRAIAKSAPAHRIPSGARRGADQVHQLDGLLPALITMR